MTSFDKAFLILETVILQNGNPVTPSSVSRLTGISLVTSSRILSMLAEKGYLERVSSRTGYVPGPMSVALTTRPNKYSQIASVCREPIRELAALSHATISVSVISGSERVMIVCEGPVPSYGYWKTFRFSCEYGWAATDRLLSACRKAVACPDRRRILEEQRVEFVEEGTGLVIIGNLILVDGYPPFAFGFGFRPENGVEAIRRACQETALKIRDMLAKRSEYLNLNP